MEFVEKAKIYLRMAFKYEPRKYWNDILRSSFDLKGVGHYRKSNEENAALYQIKARIVDELLTAASFRPSTSVLEIGCGVGFWTDHLRAKGVTAYTGNDIAQVSIETLRRRHPTFSFILGDISETEMAGGPFDLVFCIDVTQHITDDARFTAAVKRMWSSVAPGGHFLFTYWEPSTKISLSHYLHLNRIEKPRALESYTSFFGPTAQLLVTRDFNDKQIALVKKSA